MSLKKGDKVRHISGKAPSPSAENSQYIVLEYFVNVANQPMVKLKDVETGEEYFRDPDTMEKM